MKTRLTPQFTARWKIFGLAVMALLVSSACLTLAPAAPARTPTAPAGTVIAPAGTPATASTSAAAGSTATTAGTPKAPAGSPTPVGLVVAIEGTVAFGPGAVNLTQPGVGLADLASYTATLKLSFTGTQDGKAQQWSKTYVLLSAQKPAARQLTIAKSGDNADPDPLFLAEVNGTAYEQSGTAACAATVLDPANSLVKPLEPAGFLTAVLGAQAAGSATVNGVAVDHATFDERALGQAGIATTTGELWVASTGGYLVKYVLTTQGDANTFGDGITGTLSVDYELTGVNQPVAVQLPAGCPAGLVNAPQLPDAANVQNVPGLLAYDTATSVADAIAFYQKQLPGLGWMVADAGAPTDGTAALDYAQGDQTLTVIISAGASGTTVDLVLNGAQP